MHILVIIFFISGVLTQDIKFGTDNSIVLFKNYFAPFITIPDSASAICSFVDNITSSTEFCSVTFPTSAANKINLTNISVGRARSYNCRTTTGNNITGLLIVYPIAKAFVCSEIRATYSSNRLISINVPVTFGYQLPSNGTIKCSIHSINDPISVNVTQSAISDNIPIRYTNPVNSTFSDLDCSLELNSMSSQFTTRILTEPQSITLDPSNFTTNSLNFQINLNLNYQTSSDLTILCGVYERNSSLTCLNSANATKSSNWTITDNISIKATNPLQTVGLQISTTSIVSGSNGTQQLTVICCTSTQLEAKAEININVPSLFSNIIGYSYETSYKDIKYFPISSCPCDLTVSKCDLNCCCDKSCDCSNSSIIPIAGPYGGFFTRSNGGQECSQLNQDILIKHPQLFLLCLQYESSSIVGDYYINQNITKDNIVITEKMIEGRKNNAGFEFVATFSSTASSSSTTLASSSSPDTIAATTNPFLTASSPNILTIPQLDFTQQVCNIQSPIFQFTNQQSSCYTTISSCTTIPQLSTRFYLISTTLLTQLCSNSIAVRSLDSSIPIFTFYKCNNGTSTVICSNDNGFIIPDVTTNGSHCSNVVQSVAYRIFMNDSNVAFVESTVTIVTTPIILNSIFEQVFSVNFITKSITTITSLQALPYHRLIELYAAAPLLFNSASSTSVTKSGLFGYDIGKPIITVNNNTITNPTYQNIKLLKADDNNECKTDITNLPNVGFGTDSISYCLFKLLDTDFVDCNMVNKKLKDYLDTIVPNKFVAIYGDPQLSSDYVEIVDIPLVNASRSVLTLLSNETAPINEIQSICTNVVTGVLITVIYSRQGRVRNEFINNIRGVQRKYITNTIMKSGKTQSNVLMNIGVTFQLIAATSVPTTTTDTQKQSTTTVKSNTCIFDVCIDELLYPWNQNYEGKQGIYEHAYGVVLLGLTLIIIVITYPWQ